MTAARRALWPVLVLVVLISLLFAAVFPTRTWFGQRSATAAATEQLQVLREQNAALEERSEELRSQDEIERLARSEYGYVYPGEEPYAVLPPPEPAPEPEQEDDEGNLLEQTWDWITDRF